jgi:hypothetical protein
VWSVALCAILVKSDPKQIGGGFAATIAAGVVVYLLIPRARRGRIGDVRAATTEPEQPRTRAVVG